MSGRPPPPTGDPRLSICIATLDRADRIGETLDSILDGLPPSVEVVVADGASSDATPRLLAEYRSRHRALRVLRLPEKGGVDRDYCLAVEQARGEFVWLMTDDDVLVPDAVRTVLDRLDDAVDLLVVNGSVWDPMLRSQVQERKLEVREDQRIPAGDLDTLFVRAADLLSFIGSVVIRRTVWEEREREPYIGSEFIHVGVIFQRPLAGDAVLVASPLVRIRYGVAHWTSRAFRIWMFTWPRLLWSFPDVSDDAKARVSPREPYRSLRQLVLSKARGYYSRREYVRHLRSVPLGLIPRLAAWLVAWVPERLFNRCLHVLAPRIASNSEMLRLELSRSPYGPSVGPSP